MESVPPARFGPLLRRMRVSAGLSQEELAERSGLSARGVSDIERGLRLSPRPETVRRLARALALGPEERVSLIAAAHPELAEPPAETMVPSAVVRSEQAVRRHPSLESIPLTRLVGRDADVARLCALMRREEVRLVTLTGPGGVGKTQLALAVAAELADDERFTDGAALVDLAPIRDPTLVASAVAAALGTKETAGQPLIASLREALRQRRLLLVLDNFEQVLPAALLVAELLAGCPGLAVIGTSRERLHLRGERDVPVEPLALLPHAGPACGVPLDLIAAVAAVRLFVERADEARSGFALTTENAPVIAEICRRLDGLPLAIELAAAWVRVLSPAALLERLGRRLPMLGGGPRDLPARHQTLQATIAWSYDLLSAEEQALFRRLSVFTGGFTLAAAEWVMGDGSWVIGEHDASSPATHHLSPPSVLDGLASLIDKSLLRQTDGRDDEASGNPRFGMLETIREYAQERLAASDEEEVIHQRHATYFVDRAREAGNHFNGPARAAVLREIEGDHDNLRAALTWALTTGDAEMAQNLAGDLGRFWAVLGFVAEGRDWLDRALTMPEPSSPVARVDALYSASVFALFQADLSAASALASEAVALAEANGYRRGVGQALLRLGIVADFSGDLSRAVDLLEEALALFRELGELAWEGLTLRHLGLLASELGQPADATARHEEALAVWRRLDHPWGMPAALRDLADEALARGDVATALAQYQEGLTHLQRLGEKLHFPGCLWGLARVALVFGQAERATRLLSAGDALFEAMGCVPWPELRPPFEVAVGTARAALGETAFAAAWAAGRALTLDEAIAEALALTDTNAEAPSVLGEAPLV